MKHLNPLDKDKDKDKVLNCIKMLIGLIRGETCSDISSSFSLHFPSTSVSVLLCLASIIPHQSTTHSIDYDDSIHHFWLSRHLLYHRKHW